MGQLRMMLGLGKEKMMQEIEQSRQSILADPFESVRKLPWMLASLVAAVVYLGD